MLVTATPIDTMHYGIEITDSVFYEPKARYEMDTDSLYIPDNPITCGPEWGEHRIICRLVQEVQKARRLAPCAGGK